MDKSSSLGMPMQPPRNIQEVQALKLGDAPEAPPTSSAKIRSPFKTLYFYCFMHYAFFLERQLFLFFSFLLLCLLQYMFGSHHVFGERHAPFFICQEHSIFHSYRFNECSLSLLLGLACIFCLDLCSDLVISFHQGVFLPLIFIGFHQKMCL
jgi:hypothetical protein